MAVIIELYHVACELTERITLKKFQGNTLTLKIKFNDFSQKTKCISNHHPLTDLDEILPLAKKLLKEIDIRFVYSVCRFHIRQKNYILNSSVSNSEKP